LSLWAIGLAREHVQLESSEIGSFSRIAYCNMRLNAGPTVYPTDALRPKARSIELPFPSLARRFDAVVSIRNIVCPRTLSELRPQNFA
jgi:hypothetical protein